MNTIWKKVKWNKLMNLSGILILLCILIQISSTHVYGASMSLTYDKKNTNYTSKTVRAYINGKEITTGKTPGIIINSVSIVPYDLVFQKGLKVPTAYNSKTGQITMKKNNSTLKMTVGSKTAYINNKKVTMPIEPKKVTYNSSKTTKILVPTEFVALALNYGYSWTSDSQNIKAEIKVPFTYYENTKIQYYGGEQSNVIVDGEDANLQNLPVMKIDSIYMGDVNTIFAKSPTNIEYKYDKKKKVVTLTRDDTILKLTVGSKAATLNDETIDLPKAPMLISKTAKGTQYVFVPIQTVGEIFNYELAYSTINQTASLKSKPEEKENTEYFVWETTQEYLEQVNNAMATQTEYHFQTQSAMQVMIQSIFKNTAITDGTEQYIIQGSSTFGIVDAIYDDMEGNIKITCQNVMSTDMSYPFLETDTMENITTTYDPMLLTTTIRLHSRVEKPSYNVVMSPELNSIIVTVYPNYINKVTARYEDEVEYITVTSDKTHEPVVTEDSEYIYVTFPNEINAVGDNLYTEEKPYCLTSVDVRKTETGRMQMIIEKQGNTRSQILTEDNVTTIQLTNRKIKIAVDCGHGANTPGKRTPPIKKDLDFNGDGVVDAKKGEQIREHVPNVGVGQFLVEELERCGFEVYESAFGDEDIPLNTRLANIANEQCDYSVSVHFNAMGNGKTFNESNGASVYIYADAEKAGDSEELARAVLSQIVEGTPQSNRGYHKQNFAMCSSEAMGTKASILVECAFMTNWEEVETMMANEEYWKETAKEIAKGFCIYLQVPYVEE